MSNFGGPAAAANPACAAIDKATNVILMAEAIMATLVCDGPHQPIDTSYMALIDVGDVSELLLFGQYCAEYCLAPSFKDRVIEVLLPTLSDQNL
jgi:hypothetical protein